MESGTHHLAEFVVLSAVGDQDAMPEQLRDRIILRAPAYLLAGIYQQEAIGLWPNQDDAAKAGERESKDIAKPALQRF
jgi:hypothetical protein